MVARTAGPGPPSALAGAAREALAAGLVMLLLGVPLLGLRTVQQPDGLFLETRWSWVAASVVIVAVGRFLLALWRRRRTILRARREEFGGPD